MMLPVRMAPSWMRNWRHGCPRWEVFHSVAALVSRIANPLLFGVVTVNRSRRPPVLVMVSGYSRMITAVMLPSLGIKSHPMTSWRS